MKRDVAAIIVAGGSGRRFGGSVRKQYLLLNRQPLLWWSVSAFERSPSVMSITLVVPTDDMSRLRRQIRSWKFRKLAAIVPGGKTRADSVRSGLAAIPDGCRYVAVHDAVRPLVTPAVIEAVVRAARASKAALAASPSQDTVKLADAQVFVRSSPARETVWLAQTPQIFERGLLERAHKKGRRAAVTDDSQLVERLGHRVKLVQSPAGNIKVTVPMDLILAHHLLKEHA